MNKKEKLEKYYYKNKEAVKNYKIWSKMEVDHLAILDLIKEYDIKNVFEIGTWEGFTAGMMIEIGNVKVKAIDINKEMGIVYQHNFHPQLEKENYGKYAKGENYELEFADSQTYDTDEKFDMVFIDGNHIYEFVKKDRELALKIANKIIVYHDYISEPGVTKLVDENNLNKIEGTLIAYEIIKKK